MFFRRKALKVTSIGNLGRCSFPVPHLENIVDGLGLVMTKLLLVSEDEGTDK